MSEKKLSGFIAVNKPSGMTSSDVVVKVRGILRSATGDKKIKVGHLGTLDPNGAGVLPIAVGAGTKLFEYTTKKIKKYRAGICFGKTTDTLDSYGDHRIAMGFLMAGLAAEGDTTLLRCRNINTSYPGFADHLRALTN